MEVHYSNNLINKSKKINLYIFTICNNIDTIKTIDDEKIYTLYRNYSISIF